jgi:hypothetical protein
MTGFSQLKARRQGLRSKEFLIPFRLVTKENASSFK